MDSTVDMEQAVLRKAFSVQHKVGASAVGLAKPGVDITALDITKTNDGHFYVNMRRDPASLALSLAPEDFRTFIDNARALLD